MSAPLRMLGQPPLGCPRESALVPLGIGVALGLVIGMFLGTVR